MSSNVAFHHYFNVLVTKEHWLSLSNKIRMLDDFVSPSLVVTARVVCSKTVPFVLELAVVIICTSCGLLLRDLQELSCGFPANFCLGKMDHVV